MNLSSFDATFLNIWQLGKITHSKRFEVNHFGHKLGNFFRHMGKF